MRMIKKLFRLLGKDINYLVRKRQYFVYDILGAYYVPQYPNRQYNQISVNIGLGVSKSAVTRHLIKRMIMRYVSDHDLQHKPFGTVYYKCFIMIHKAQMPAVQKLIASMDKKDIHMLLDEKCDMFFNRLYNRLGISSKK